ncbi:unnamed protein product [Rotaria socialis]
MELNRFNNTLSVPAHTEVVFCSNSLKFDSRNNQHTSVDQKEVNRFGLTIFKQIYWTDMQVYLHPVSSYWCLLNPSEGLKRSRKDERYDHIQLQDHNIILAFGSLISPQQFKCVATKFQFEKQSNSDGSLYFAKYNSFISIHIEHVKFQLKRDHIDNHRGVIIDVKSSSHFIMHICLKGNLEEYACQDEEAVKDYKRQFCLHTARGQQWQPSFSTMRLSINNIQTNDDSVHNALSYFIQFFTCHSIPIHFGSINFSNKNSIYRNNLLRFKHTFIFEYALDMLTSVGCQIYEQIVNNQRLVKYIKELLNDNYSDSGAYYIFERLRRFVLSSESYFPELANEWSTIWNRYHTFYLGSTFYRIDNAWENYVRIPWFCLTPTRRIVKPFKFMQSNRVFRYISNVHDSMAIVEFRDDTGSAYLGQELVSFLEHYLTNGFWFGDRHYIHLHHAQSKIRQKQFYFYCEAEGKMTREKLESWMGNFDDERLPAKNTARRTQPFSSTEATIEIDKKFVASIRDFKTEDNKYNFTDGVGQISSELNLLIHKSIGVDVDGGGYVSSVLQIRYAGCKGTVTVNPLLDGETKQLLIRPSMNKFKCDHQMLELCKRSLRRNLCLNRQVINLLSHRNISNSRILVLQLQNILWLIKSLVSNQSAVSLLREKILSILPWSEISAHLLLCKEPFFRRLLLVAISNNLNQIVTRAHIRVPKARYMFGVVDECEVLNEGQVFVQITHEDGTKTVLEGSVAITKNPCHHPGDLRALQAVNHERLHHLYDVVVFPKRGLRPHPSEISGSDLDGDEYTVIWDPELVPISPNPIPYEYDAGQSPKPLNRIVTRDDRIKVLLDICEQDNLGLLSNLHLIFVDKFGIDSEEATNLAAAISEELDSVKSGQHPYTPQQIRELLDKAGKSRPDFMQACNYEQYPSQKILGKLFRSARSLSDSFNNVFPNRQNTNDEILLDNALLHNGYQEYVDAARSLYVRYQYEMFEIIGSYGFSNEIDLFCCIDSCEMKANERSDIQQTAQKLLKAVFRDIRQSFFDDIDPFQNSKAKASACYYVAYTDKSSKEQRMLSFPWLFASQLLANDTSMLENPFSLDSYWQCCLKKQFPSIRNLRPNDNQFMFMELFDMYSKNASNTNDEQMINNAEILIKHLITAAKFIHSN